MAVPANKISRMPGGQVSPRINPADVPNAPADATVFLSEQQIQEIEERIKKDQAQKMARVDALAGSLVNLAKVEWGNRQVIEQRWLEDLQQYEGQYDDKTLVTIRSNKGSELFINITRPKVKTAKARLGDMLFPTDDTNWDIGPTAVPSLMRMQNDNTPLRDNSGNQVMGPPGANGEPAKPLTMADRAAHIMRKAKLAAAGMKAEIEDQLGEADYPIHARMAIHDACLLGTGIIKGPIVFGRTRRTWEKRGNVRVLSTTTDERPGCKRVDPWNYFPQNNAGNKDECQYEFERSYLTARQLMELGKDQYYMGGNILRALAAGAGASQITLNPTMVKRDNNNSEASTSGAAPGTSELFECWEYHGVMERADLEACGVDIPDDIPDGVITGCVVFVGGVVIKAYLNPLETGDSIYSVYNYCKSEDSIFGYGIPYEMRHAQRMLNAAVRAMLDNAGLSAGPQVIINKKGVQPADGDYTLRRSKVWELIDATKRVEDVMKTFNIESHQAELEKIIILAQKFADEVSSLPLIAQGEQGPSTKTLGGMSLLNNNANVITRDSVKNWDDGVTHGFLTRMYDWNMQNSPNEEIKGDYEVDARGSSVLLSKEIQAQNLMALGANYAPSPLFGPMMKPIELLRKIVQAMHVAQDDIVKSDSEWEAWQRDQQQGDKEPPEVKVEKMRQEFEGNQLEREISAKEKLEQTRHNNKMQELNLENQDNMLRYATQERMNLDDLKAMLAGKQLEGQNKRIIQGDELAFKAATGKPGV